MNRIISGLMAALVLIVLTGCTAQPIREPSTPFPERITGVVGSTGCYQEIDGGSGGMKIIFPSDCRERVVAAMFALFGQMMHERRKDVYDFRNELAGCEIRPSQERRGMHYLFCTF